MKKLTLLVLGIVSILFSACVKDAADEGVSPDFIPHFNYGGYTYYIHPTLGEMEWKDAIKACNNLKAYGYNDWFLPSQGEISAAPMDYFLDAWSSTPDGDYYYYLAYWNEWNSYYQSAMHQVVPVRKQATALGK